MASLPAIRRQGLRMTSLSLSTLASSSSSSAFITDNTLESLYVQRKQKQQQRNLMTTTSINTFTSCQHHDNYAKNQTRWFGRKAAKMGRHRETLEELAHSKEHDEAVERRKANKKRKQGGGTAATEKDDDELVPPMEEDASEIHFGGDLGGDEEDDSIPELPDPSDVKQRMLRVVDRLVESFKAVRGAEPTPELFDPIMVEAYGDKVNLSAVAQVVIVSPTLATVSCFDPSLAKDVKTAIQVQLELNPQLEEDGMVKVPLPRASAESRTKTVKLLGKQAEIGRTRIRNIRRAAMDIVKKGKDGKLDGISKDDAFRASKDIDAVTEEVIGMLNEQVEFKQESVMAV